MNISIASSVKGNVAAALSPVGVVEPDCDSATTRLALSEELGVGRETPGPAAAALLVLTTDEAVLRPALLAEVRFASLLHPTESESKSGATASDVTLRYRAPCMEIAFVVNEHTPTKGVALVAHCKTSQTCLEFAAAYRAAVPTAKPTPICGANPNVGAIITGGKSVLPPAGTIAGVRPDKKDAQSQCVRLAACKAARDHGLTSDESQACMQKPSSFKLPCALKTTCDEVLACVGS